MCVHAPSVTPLRRHAEEEEHHHQPNWNVGDGNANDGNDVAIRCCPIANGE